MVTTLVADPQRVPFVHVTGPQAGKLTREGFLFLLGVREMIPSDASSDIETLQAGGADVTWQQPGLSAEIGLLEQILQPGLSAEIGLLEQILQPQGFDAVLEPVFQPLPALTPDPWIAPALLNGWIAFGGAFNAPGYYKDATGVVHLRGMLKTGTVGLASFVLPVGYRPDATWRFACVSNAAFGIADADASGNVTLQLGSNVYFSLDGVTFRAT